ncbi:MAG TPA: universal stress protein [Rhodanobacteraceae bacterium]|nr:universal stress protein [Rhodanobacteraceae bacterium]
MGEADTIAQPPRSILLATDREAHSDRALDRAAMLARQWRAALHVVHVLRPGAPDDWWASGDDGSAVDHAAVERLERQIRRDLHDPPDELVVHVTEGEPADSILETAEREGCGLVVAGTRGSVFADLTGHSTTAQLLRRSPSSVLVVKSRPHGPYQQVLVGTDLTPESRHGLETAAAWFADAAFTLMHALDIPHRSLLLDADRGQAFVRLERDTVRSFVDGARLPDGIRRQLRTHVEHGPPEILLRRCALADDIDLTVIGALRRGLPFRILVGGNATRIVEAAPGDVLTVRATPADSA